MSRLPSLFTSPKSTPTPHSIFCCIPSADNCQFPFRWLFLFCRFLRCLEVRRYSHRPLLDLFSILLLLEALHPTAQNSEFVRILRARLAIVRISWCYIRVLLYYTSRKAFKQCLFQM